MKLDNQLKNEVPGEGVNQSRFTSGTTLIRPTWRILTVFVVFIGLWGLWYFTSVGNQSSLFNAIFMGFATLGICAFVIWLLGLTGNSSPSIAAELAENFLETLDEGVCFTDAKGNLIFANKAYKNLMGAGDEADLRAVETVFCRERDAADAIARINHALASGAEGREEIRLPVALSAANNSNLDISTTHVDGHWYAVSARTMPHRTSKALIVWRVADISANRKAQETIFQELQTAIDYLDHSPVGFLSVNPNGRLAYINVTLAQWLGFDIAEMEPSEVHFFDLIDPAAAAHLLTEEGQLAVPSSTKIDIDFIHKDGKKLPMQIVHDVPFDENGAVGASRTIILNRFQGAEPAEALRAAEIRFSRFFNNTPIAMASISRDRRIGRCNGKFVTLFGRDYTAGRQKDIVDVVSEGERSDLRAAITSAINGKSNIAPLDVTLPGHPERAAKLYLSGVEQNDDNESAIMFALETTEQRALEEQFAQSQKMQAIGQLAGGVAHDFNNVLTAIIGYSDLLLSSHTSSDPNFQDIMQIKNNANRAAGLVRQLLAFSRRQTLRPQVLQLIEIMNDVSIMLGRLLGEKVELKVQHDRNLWPVKADLNQFEQVIMNLAVNARDAMPEGGQVQIVTENISSKNVGQLNRNELDEIDYVSIKVTDTGTGMSAETISKVFEPFFTTKDVGEGTGLGLSTVYGIVKQTGGYIYVDSELGAGTTFQILLPRHHIDETAIGDKQITVAEVKQDLTGSAVILLVEDEEAVRAFASRALASRGYKVYEAVNGMEALELVEEIDEPLDLVISDVMMPEMDGPTLLKELRAKHPKLKTIFVSGYAEDAFDKSLDEDEDFTFLPKPFSLKQLAEAVKNILEA